MPTPYENPELYDSVILAGVRSPGTVKLSGHDRKVDWDVKNGPGLNGATTNLKGIPPVTFTATFYLVQDDYVGIDDFADWEEFRALIKSSFVGTKPKALEIYHPDLAANDIKSVCGAQIGGVTHDGKGGQTVAVQFIEYRPPKKAGGSPNGAKTKKKDDPDAAALAELDALTKKYAATPWG